VLELGSDLELRGHPGGRWLVVDSPGGTVGALAFEATRARFRLGLSLLGGDRVIDVSIDPAVWIGHLQQRAADMDQHPQRWRDAICTALDRHGVAEGWWAEPLRSDPLAVATATAWPLLRPSVAAGHLPASVPRWAAELLSGPDVATAVRRELAGRQHRRLVRAVGARLRGPVSWWPLALVLALPAIDADRAANLLEADGNSYLASQDDFGLLGDLLGGAPPGHAVRLATSTGDPDRLCRALRDWARARRELRTVPRSIEALEDLLGAALIAPVAPALRHERDGSRAPTGGDAGTGGGDPGTGDGDPGNAGGVGPLEGPGEGAQPARAQRRAAPRQAHHRARAAPTAAPVAGGARTERFVYDEPWHQLHRRARGDLELVLPATPAELDGWSRTLHNCLDTFGAAVASGRSLIVGIRVDGLLRGAAEITPATGRIVQLLGARNRPLAARLEADACELLAEAGVHPPTVP